MDGGRDREKEREAARTLALQDERPLYEERTVLHYKRVALANTQLNQ